MMQREVTKTRCLFKMKFRLMKIDVYPFKGLNEIINDMEKNDYMNSLTPVSFSQSNEYLEMTLSPKSVESQTSCRSHDGVFLRPGEQQKKSLRYKNKQISYSFQCIFH